MQLRVKICGITQADQGLAIAQLGATALGFICVPQSPRYVTPEQIRAIVEQLSLAHLSVDRIAVFANANLEEICRTVAIAHLSGIQLHGHESPHFCRQVQQALPQVEIIKALRIKDAQTLEQAKAYSSVVQTLLLDAYHPQVLGGTGHTIDWSLLTNLTLNCPWLLAGGLTPHNVLVALQQLQPHGIDLSSGVEHSPGNKDLTQVSHLFHQLQQWQSR